jgi:hypothetical protein
MRILVRCLFAPIEDQAMKNLLHAGFAALTLTLAGTSLAGNPAPKVPDGPTVDFAKADRNGDGRISREESLLVPDLGSAFEMLDSDQNELLSRTEFSRWSRAGEVDLPGSDAAPPPRGAPGSGNLPED